nr:hypothetical protein [Tanacetum cinerariifolium]
MSHPPGFTPVGFGVEREIDISDGDVNKTDNGVSHSIDDKVLDSPQKFQGEDSSDSIGLNGGNNGGSVFGVLKEVIRVGQAIGYSMEGCEKDVEAIIGSQGDDVVFR